MAPKKGKKMDLSAFLADEATGSWADEMESFPTAPSGEPTVPGALGGSHLSSRGGGDFNARSGGFGDRESYGDRPQRVEVPFPTAPPYTAFVGNLNFDFGESDLENFFSGMSTTSIRLVMGQDMKPKGFGYVEFENSDDLRKALDLSGTDVGGRTVRISVAEAPKGREGRADEEISWTRQGPLAPLAGRSGGFGNRDGGGGGFDRPRDNGFGGGERADPEGARMGFGSKFVASVDSPRRGGGGFDRSASGGSSYDRAGAGGEGEDRGERAGFGSRFVPAAPVSERPPFGGDRRVSGPGEGRSDAESSWSRSGPLAPLPSTGGRNGGSFGDRAASGGFGDRSASGSYGDRSSPAPEAPRQRLQLSARSTTASPAGTPTAPSSSKSNPFGSAAPVDNSLQIQKAEEKLAAQRAESAARNVPTPRVEREFVRKEVVGDVREEEKKAAAAIEKVEVTEVSDLLGEVTI